MIAVLSIVERKRVESRFGKAGVDALLNQVGFRIEAELAPHEPVGRSGRGCVLLLLRGTVPWQVGQRLERIVRLLTRTPLTIGRERLHVTPTIGWAAAGNTPADRQLDTLLARSFQAGAVAERHLDLVPRQWTPDTPSGGRALLPNRLRTPLQILATMVIGLLAPFLLMVQLDRFGIDSTPAAYLLVTGALLVTGVAIWAESFSALDPKRPPARPRSPYPAASAIIPAQLPNEAATILETVKSFLELDYPGPLQVVLAYNTPHELPVEAELRAVAARDARFVPLPVPGSRSKAQNVNAALQAVTGEFTGVFDAGHHPERNAFRRAWRWLSSGADVVQGHRTIRNGAASWVARTVAVEFESIYAVGHPGRDKLHGFGLLSGSNGFWRTSLLHEIRMRYDMLTEDLDSSIRVLLAGKKVVSDPALVSHELAPATLSALWHQRIRWAQGWCQVSRRHLGNALRNEQLTGRNKLGMLFLLGWRQIYPWLSMQFFPVLAFLAWRDGVDGLNTGIPIFVLTVLYTLSVGPGQVLFTYRLAAPEVRRRRWWFWSYLVVSALCYAELKNLIVRVAQVKELTGERTATGQPGSAEEAA